MQSRRRHLRVVQCATCPVRELTSLRVVQSASWQSASWCIRELSSYRYNSHFPGAPDLASPPLIQRNNWCNFKWSQMAFLMPTTGITHCSLSFLHPPTNSHRKGDHFLRSPAPWCQYPVDWLSCGFTSHSTQNRSFRRRSQANLLAWYGKTKANTTEAHIHQSKEMNYNTK